MASESKNDFHETLLGRNHSVPFRALSQRSFFQCLLPFPSAILSVYLLKLFLLPQRAHTTLFTRYDKPVLTRWCLCSLTRFLRWSGGQPVVAIPSQKALLMYSYVSSGKFSVHAPCCSRALLHNLQLTSDRCLIFASHLATGMIPAIAVISRL